MKLNRLSSSSQQHALEAAQRVRPPADEEVLRVNAMEGIEPDPQQTLQQEISLINPNEVDSFKGNERILEDAKELAAELCTLGKALDHLIKPPPDRFSAGIDDQA